jgi:diacylglycerol kinase (ATP)
MCFPDENETTVQTPADPKPQTERPFSTSARLRSFVYAGRGIRTMLVSQHNAWIHAVATLGVVVAGLVFGIPRSEWYVLILAIVAVWTAEALNTALEFLCDVASPEFHPLVEKAKDVAAGAVLDPRLLDRCRRLSLLRLAGIHREPELIRLAAGPAPGIRT